MGHKNLVAITFPCHHNYWRQQFAHNKHFLLSFNIFSVFLFFARHQIQIFMFQFFPQHLSSLKFINFILSRSIGHGDECNVALEDS